MRKLSHGRGLRAAPPTPPARLFCRWQEVLPRQNCWPEASLGKVPCASRTRRGMTRMIMSPAQSQKTCFCCHCFQRRQVLALLGEADQSQPDPQQSSLPDAWQHLEQFVTFKDTASTFHPNNHARYQKTNGKRGPQSLILASIFFLCFLVLGWSGQVDKLLKKGKYHFNLFLRFIMANHRKADSNSRLAIALRSSHYYQRNFKSHTPQIP